MWFVTLAGDFEFMASICNGRSHTHTQSSCSPGPTFPLAAVVFESVMSLPTWPKGVPGLIGSTLEAEAQEAVPLPGQGWSNPALLINTNSTP